MRTEPILPYVGLTIVLANPSRFDKKELLSGTAGRFVDNVLARNKLTRLSVCVSTLGEALLPNTKVVLLCGADCLKFLNKHPQQLDTLRGSPFVVSDVIYIPTYFPQDCLDPIDYESYLNPIVGKNTLVEVKQKDNDDLDTKDKGRTSRANYRFWFEKDLSKAIDIYRHGLKRNTCVYDTRGIPQELVKFLNSLNNSTLFLDIETHPVSGQITCFAVSEGKEKVLTFSLINYRREKAQPDGFTGTVIRSLAGAFRRNRVICHNSLFDLFILLWKYKIPPPPMDNIYCTMTAWHRLYPDVEKSLGHLISVATHEIYHKDSGIFEPKSYDQERQLLLYNAKDVERMALVYYWLEDKAVELEATESVRQGNASIRLYLTMMYRGIRLDVDNLCKHIDKLRRRSDFFEKKILPRLIGHALNPRSPQQVASYIYDELKVSKPSNGQATNKFTLYSILLQRNIPALYVILALRRWGGEASKLSFKLWQETRATCAYVITGTETFRLSSRKLLKYKSVNPGYGTNLQNQNKERTRYLFIPDND